MAKKISVVIPVYNAATTVGATLDSVLAQTVSPYEILVFDDGSSDSTLRILRSYIPRVYVIPGNHQGVATARNILCARAKGDLLAFLDADDLWHPQYLECQTLMSEQYGAAAGFFTAHIDFQSDQDIRWTPFELNHSPSILSRPVFFDQFQRSPGSFLMSSFCVPKWVLTDIGDQPFGPPGQGAEDWYFTMMVALRGPAVKTPAPMVGYRITANSQSSNRLVSYGDAVGVYEQLKGKFNDVKEENFSLRFELAFASKRRQYAKMLLGAGRWADGRKQLKLSLRDSSQPISLAKSLALLSLSHLPKPLQPKWPASQRPAYLRIHHIQKDSQFLK